MPFNVDKCKFIHISYPKANYSLLGNTIASVDQEEDLRVTVSKDLKPIKKCLKVEKKAEKIIGCIKRQFKHRTTDVILQPYTSLVRPYLEYAVQFWSPILERNIEIGGCSD